MLGSPFDADDAVQETMIRALRSLDGFDGRASLRTWLHRIATNVCLDALATRKRRGRPLEEGSSGTPHDALETRPRTHWLEPVPEERVIAPDADPAERLQIRQNIRLAFVAALQHLPPKQRAALLLTEVVGFSVDEVAASLDTSADAIHSALQRARATLAKRDLRTDDTMLDDRQRILVDRYARAFEAFDVDLLASLLTEDAVLSMPPYTLWLEGPTHIGEWLRGRGNGCAGSRLVPIAASGLPAFAQYRNGGADPFAILVLELRGDRVARMTSFLDVSELFPLFGMPPRLAPAG